MSAVPFMQLYVADYLGDTQHLTTEQHGAYLLILMAMWRAGGQLPAEPTRLARIARVTPARWKKIAGDVLAFFEVRDGKLTQKRLRREIEKASDISRKRSSAGARGAAAKHLKAKNVAPANGSDLPEHDQTPESNTTPVDIDRDRAMAEQIAAAGGAALHEHALADLSPLAGWLAAGADFAADVLPVIVARCRGKRRGSVRSLAYFDAALAEALERKSAAPDFRHQNDRRSGTANRKQHVQRSAHDVLAAGMARAIGAAGDGDGGGRAAAAAGEGADTGDEGVADRRGGAAQTIDLARSG